MIMTRNSYGLEIFSTINHFFFKSLLGSIDALSASGLRTQLSPLGKRDCSCSADARYSSLTTTNTDT
ncbi:hypothetical protein MRB53_008686 [Persea americana]|uniref:Uncharacterized protein n=1 Tax=Persea americana TaxID=3435 RepID=A0ACC2MN60_PERAE|nr:hypothetical protein MRB53_008686 [Persea americana]